MATLAADPEGVAVDTSSFAQETSVVFAVEIDDDDVLYIATPGAILKVKLPQ